MSNAIRFALIFVSLSMSFLLAPSALAASQRPYDANVFKTAQAAGEPVLVEIHADWCPTCRAQMPVLNKLSADSKYSGVVRLRVDFDSQKDVVKGFNARTQSTLILFKGQKEVARSVGVTDAKAIQAMLDKAL